MAQPEPAGSLSGGDVPDLFVAGYSAKQIAPVVGLCVRRVRQLIAAAGLRPSPKPVPSPSLLEQILTSEVARHGGSYGYGMLSGVLAARYPQFRFPRRRVLAALQRLFPHAAARRYEWTAQRLERGRYFAPTSRTDGTWTTRASFRTTISTLEMSSAAAAGRASRSRP